METLELIIEAFIRENGGAEKLAHDIECEWCKYFYFTNPYYSHSETIFLLANYRTKTTDYIARRLNRSFSSVKAKIRQLREKSLIDYKKTKKVSLL